MLKDVTVMLDITMSFSKNISRKLQADFSFVHTLSSVTFHQKQKDEILTVTATGQMAPLTPFCFLSEHYP